MKSDGDHYSPHLIEEITNILYQMGEDWTEEFCPDLDALAEQIIDSVRRMDVQS